MKKSLIDRLFPCEKRLCDTQKRFQNAVDALIDTLNCEEKSSMKPIKIAVKEPKHGNHANPRQV